MENMAVLYPQSGRTNKPQNLVCNYFIRKPLTFSKFDLIRQLPNTGSVTESAAGGRHAD